MFFWISCIAAGSSLCLFIWVFSRPVIIHAGMAGQGHWILKALWPWVLAFATICKPFVPWGMRERLERSILLAGLDRSWRPEHLVGIQIMVAVLLAGASFLALSMVGSFTPGAAAGFGVSAAAVGAWWPRRWLRDSALARQRLMLREFPFMLDMTTLCVEAGLNLQGALQQAALHGPEGPLRNELRHALADIRAGMPRLDALRELARRTDLLAMHQLATALGQADKLGMSLGPLLRAQSEQRRTERFLRAEKLALEAPVKMLFPMVFCIFPCTFLIIGFPIAVKLMDAGL